MNDHDERLAALLAAAFPVGTPSGDWNEVVRRADAGRGRRRLVRFLAPVLAVAGLVAVLVVLLVQTTDTGQVEPAKDPARTDPGGGAELAILDRAQTLEDRLDPTLPSDWPIDYASTRLAQEREGDKIFVSRSTGGLVCLGADFRRYWFNWCRPATELATAGAITLVVDTAPGGPVTLTGVVPDGTTKARAGGVTVDVSANTYAIESATRDIPIEVLTPTGWQTVGLKVPNPTYSILKRPRTAQDAPPQGGGISSSDSSGQSPPRPVLAEARFALERDGRRYFVAPERDGDLCVVVAVGNNLDLACRNPATLANIDAFMLLTDRYQVTIVPDGLDQAQVGSSRIPIEGNVLVFTRSNSPGRTATLSGPAGTFELELPPTLLEPQNRPLADRLPVEFEQRRAILLVDLEGATPSGGNRPAGRTATLWVAPRTGGGRCWWITTGADENATFSEQCEEAPPELSAGGAGLTFLAIALGPLALGAATGDVSSVEVTFKDGRTSTFTPVEGLIMARVEQHDVDPDTGPATMRTLAGSRVLKTYNQPTARADLGPAMSSIGEFPQRRAPSTGP